MDKPNLEPKESLKVRLIDGGYEAIGPGKVALVCGLRQLEREGHTPEEVRKLLKLRGIAVE